MTTVEAYECADGERRREETRAGKKLNGIDVIDVDPGQRTLLVRLLLPVPASLGPRAVAIAGGVRADPAINPVRVLWALPASGLAGAGIDPADVVAFSTVAEPDHVLVVRTSSTGDFSTYRFVVTDPAAHKFDPRLAAEPFTFKLDCPVELDCAVAADCPPERSPEPDIDYLNRDYVALRRLLLDRLSVVIPPWTDRNAADLGVLLVELFAYLGDQLAYAQDAIAAEAYLGTARRRVSVARHARQLDYPMHQGAAARTWLVAHTEDVDGPAQSLPAGREVTGADDAVVFHTLHPLVVWGPRAAIDFYTWGDQRCCLPRGATTATLVGTVARLCLRAGDVLVFEEVPGPDGAPWTPDVTHRCAVRLAADPVDDLDPVTGVRVVQVTWFDEDALPFPLCLWRSPRGRCEPDAGAAVAWGNVVLVEHGRTVGTGPGAPGPAPDLAPRTVPERGPYRPRLGQPGLAYAVPYDHATARGRSAAAALVVDPQQALPQLVRLSDGHTTWQVQRDLLGSDRFAPDAVVEMDDDRVAHLRFGDDVLGRRPTAGDTFTAHYRLGGGRAGNCGRDRLTALTEPLPGVSVRNPLPATGGADPQPVEQVRQWAPQAFRRQERAVTDADYTTVAERLPQVQRAAATRRWTGSWYTEFVTVDRRGGAEVDGPFRSGLIDFLETFRMAGVDVEVDAPVFVPLDIVFTVCVAPGHDRAAVHRRLDETFSARDRPGGERGFFHPDNLTFAQPVHLSQLVAAAMAIDGVAWVDFALAPDKPNRFQRWGRPAGDEARLGRIALGRLEVARCDSDPDRPEHGRIAFVMLGGL